MTTTTVLLVVLVSTLGALAQGATGSGYGIVTAPLLLLVSPASVPGPLLVSTVLVMALVVHRHRRSLAAAELGPAVVGALPGIGLGLLVASVLPARTAVLLVGLVVLAGVVAGLLGRAVPATRATTAGAGVLAGVFTVLAATPGPPLMLLRQDAHPDRTRANLSLYFLVVSALTLVTVLLVGGSRAAHWPAVVPLVLGAGAGFWAGRPLLRLVSAARLRRLALALCLLASLSLITRSLLG